MTAQPAAIDPPSADWHERAERIAFDGRPFVDGAARPPCSRATIATECPFPDQPLAAITACDAADVERGVAAARRGSTGLYGVPAPPTPQSYLLAPGGAE